MIDIAAIPAALLAGGLATRLRPITHSIPKAMVEVAGKPFIDHQLALLHRNGIRKVVLCLGHLGEQVRDHLGDGSAMGMELQYSFDGAILLGTGGALLRALPYLGSAPDDAFWVMYGDSYMDMDYQAVWEHFARSAADGLMTVLRNGNRWDKSNVLYRDGRLLRYDKKHPSADMDHIDYGVALLRIQALSGMSPGQPFDLAGLYSDLVAEGRMIGYEVSKRFYEIGTPEALEEARRYLVANSVKSQ